MNTLPQRAYVLAASTLLACSTFAAAPQDSLADAGDATGVDGTPDGARPRDCDVTKSPQESPACIVDTVGIFVSPAGDDTATGTKDRPVKTLGKAVALAAGSRLPRVYVCEGAYDTNLVLTNLASPLAIHGGLTCTWAPADVKPRLVPPTGIALRVTNVTTALLLQDLAITGTADPGLPGDSAVAVFVSASPNVTFRNVALRAGPGTHGKDQTKGAPGALMTSAPTAGTLDGNRGDATKGGSAQNCTCARGATTKGGGGGNLNADGSPGEPAQATPEPATATGEAGRVADCTAGAGAYVNGRPGSNAPASPGAPGAAQSGTLTPSGWTPEPGKDALDGPPGQGGGGGGGAAGGGGGGACGGCGGEGGKGGGGGGASVALLTFESPVALLNVSLTSANAGAGGAGAQGGDGIPGGTRGSGGVAACNGGNGGKGGNGGAGGGGAGGVSAGVLAKGAPPTLDATSTVTTGAKGAPGPGAASNNGVDGQKADTLVLP